MAIITMLHTLTPTKHTTAFTHWALININQLICAYFNTDTKYRVYVTGSAKTGHNSAFFKHFITFL